MTPVSSCTSVSLRSKPLASDVELEQPAMMDMPGGIGGDTASPVSILRALRCICVAKAPVAAGNPVAAHSLTRAGKRTLSKNE